MAARRAQGASGTAVILAFVFLVLGIAGRVRALAARPANVLVLRAAHVHDDARAHLLPEFKYGWSQPPSSQDVPREVRDRDYFYIWSFSAWGVWAALGLVYIWEQLASHRRRPGRTADGEREKTGRGDELADAPRIILAAPVLLIAFIPLFANWKFASRAGQTFTDDWAHDLLNSVEPYGILITNGDNDTFPLWYAQEVEGVRQDVTVAVTTISTPIGSCGR